MDYQTIKAMAKEQDGIAEAGQPGLYDAICDAARAIVSLPTQERLGAVEFLACELRGYLAESGLSESGQREIIARLVSELQREA